MGLLDQLLFGGSSPYLPRSQGFPEANPLTEEEIAAASRPAMFGSQPMMGGVSDMIAKARRDAAAANPFTRGGVAPILAAPSGLETGFGGPSAGAQGGGMDEAPGSVQPDGEKVPLPRPRPAGVDMSARGVGGGPAGEPLSLAPPAPGPMAAPPMPQQAAGQSPGAGFLQTISDNTPLLLALAGGFAGAPSIGTGMRRAFSNAAPVAAVSQKRKDDLLATAQSRDQIYRDLVAKGVPPADARAAAANPAILKEVADKYYGAGKEPKPPTIQEFTVPGGGTVKRQWNPATGAWDDVPGTAVNMGDKRQKLGVADVKKLSEDARNMQAIDRYNNTFKDQFAGDISETWGDIKNQFGDKVPGASTASKERSQWWRDYQEYRNAVRHGLYGSALTQAETANFLKQDITPGMQPDQIRAVLKRQQEIVRNAMKREGSALIEAGHARGAISKAYGVDPGFFDSGAAAKGGSGKTASGVSWKVEDDD